MTEAEFTRSTVRQGNVRKRVIATLDARDGGESFPADPEEDTVRPVKRKPPPTTTTAAERVRHTDRVDTSFAASGTAMPSGPADQNAAAPARETEAPTKKKPMQQPRTGPVRAPQNIRSTCRFDFQPDVCKDYHDTGYCSFGDNCKFLHDRGDYKSGWQLEREWDDEQSARVVSAFQQFVGSSTTPAKTEETGEEHEEELPFACLKCHAKWGAKHKPVQIRCQHLFCEQCMLAWFKKSTKCPLCNAPTGGVYSTPCQLLDRLERARQRALAAVCDDGNPDADETAEKDEQPRDSRIDRRSLA